MAMGREEEDGDGVTERKQAGEEEEAVRRGSSGEVLGRRWWRTATTSVKEAPGSLPLPDLDWVGEEEREGRRAGDGWRGAAVGAAPGAVVACAGGSIPFQIGSGEGERECRRGREWERVG